MHEEGEAGEAGRRAGEGREGGLWARRDCDGTEGEEEELWRQMLEEAVKEGGCFDEMLLLLVAQVSCIYVYMYICMYVCMYVCTYIRMRGVL